MDITFGLDIDGVIRNICAKSLELYNKEFGENVKFKDWKHYDVGLQFPRIQKEKGYSASKWLFDVNGLEIFRYSEPIGNPSDLVKRLKKFGKVVIISYQKSFYNKIDTLWWLEDHSIKYDDICFVKDKSIIHVDYLIDDNPAYLLNSNCEHAILIDAPYNKDTIFDNVSSRTTYDRFESLESFVKRFEEDNG